MNILVTGSSAGLGHSICKALYEDNHNVIGLDDIPGEYTTHIGSVDNVYDLRKVRMVQNKFNLIINNAAANRLDWVDDVTVEVFSQIMKINVIGILLAAKVFHQDLKDTQGVILNILSDAAVRPMINSISYNCSKSAAQMMTLQLAREFKKDGIIVFGISPTKIKGTDMSKYIDSIVPKLRGWSEEEAKDYERKHLPLGGEIDPTILARFITFLFSFRENYQHLSGSIINYGHSG